MVITRRARRADAPLVQALRRARHRWLRCGRDDAGFGLLELVVASTVMMTALTSMAYVTTSAFGDIAMAKERQSANALLDGAIERLRALPYDTVSLGMRTADLAGDPRVIGSGTAAAPYRLATTNERIVHVSTNQIVAPLVPNVSSRTIDNKVYAVRVYLTHFHDDPGTGAVTATAYVDWTSSARNAAAPAFLRASTVIFSPAAASAGSSASAACMSTSTHPFSGPCLPFFHAAASADAGRIVLGGDGRLGTVVGGTTIAFPEALASMQSEQTVAVHGRAVSAGATRGTTRQGLEPSTSKADDDPASSGSVGYDSRTGSAMTTSISATSATTSLSVTGSGSAATSVSTTAASDARVCRNVGDTANLTDGQPCGRSSASLASMEANVVLGTLDLTASLLGSISPVTVSGVRSTAHADRERTSTAGVCAGTSAVGCVRSTATRSIDAIRIGGMPSGQALVRLDGFTSTVTAEAGINAAAPTATATGVVRVWNPLLLGGLGGYDTVAVAFGSGATITTPTVTINNLVTLGLTLTVSATLRTGTSSVSSTAGTCLTTLACRTRADASLGSPIVGDVHYVFQFGSSIVRATVSVDLGNLSASAGYADPPTTA